jgi:hypothetical protein
MKLGHLLVGPAAIAPRPTNRPISAAMRPVFSSAPTILVWSRRLQQSFKAEEIYEVTDSCSADGERVNNIYMRTGLSGPILTFLFILNFIQQNGRYLKKIFPNVLII